MAGADPAAAVPRREGPAHARSRTSDLRDLKPTVRATGGATPRAMKAGLGHKRCLNWRQLEQAALVGVWDDVWRVRSGVAVVCDRCGSLPLVGAARASTMEGALGLP